MVIKKKQYTFYLLIIFSIIIICIIYILLNKIYSTAKKFNNIESFDNNKQFIINSTGDESPYFSELGTKNIFLLPNIPSKSFL